MFSDPVYALSPELSLWIDHVVYYDCPLICLLLLFDESFDQFF